MAPTEKEIKSIGDCLREIPPDQDESSFQVIRDFLDDKKEQVTIRLQNRKLQPEPPVRSESPKRNHVFHDAAGFSEYLKKYGSANTVVFASAEHQSIYAILDEKAEKGFESVTLSPVLHPLFAPWDEVLGKTLRLDKFVEFLLANRRAIYRPEGRELLLQLSQIRASNKTTLSRGHGAKSSNGIMCDINIQAEVKSELVDLPEILELSCPIYYGTSSRMIEIDIIMSMQNDEIAVLITSADIAVAKLDCFDGMLELLKANKKHIVTTGYPAAGDWDYIE